MTPRAEAASASERDEWSTDRCTITIEVRSNTVILVSASGHLDVESGKWMAATVEARLREQARHAFFDLDQLEGYHPEVRKDMTRVLLEQRPRVLSIHVLARSKIVRMGVAVVTLVLRGLISHDHRNDFIRALNTAVRGA